jgi:hypothetical protein
MATNLSISTTDQSVQRDGILRLEAGGGTPGQQYVWYVVPKGGTTPVGTFRRDEHDPHVAFWQADGVEPGTYVIHLFLFPPKDDLKAALEEARRRLPNSNRSETILVQPRALAPGDEVPIRINLSRTSVPATPQVPFWDVLRAASDAVSFNNYAAWIDFVFYCNDSKSTDLGLPQAIETAWEEARNEINPPSKGGQGAKKGVLNRLKSSRFPSTSLPFPDIEAYRLLKAATEAFLMINCGIYGFGNRSLEGVDEPSLIDLEEGLSVSKAEAQQLYRELMKPISGNGTIWTVPYLALIQQRLKDISITTDATRLRGELCYAIIREKFTNPCLLELLWSYWHEEGMVTRSIDAVASRFQNQRSGRDREPLAALNVDPLRPLGNLLWGYIQDEQHRLTAVRRNFEYDHEYGVSLSSLPIPPGATVDSRSRFLGAFHNLLHRASIFYKEDDDTTTIADPFPVLNALREVHLLLAEGNHNQYGDLTWTARHEMLMQQWLLARPELNEFLPGLTMVAYPEPWMPQVDAMKKLQGWDDTSVRYFSDLGRFGEQILLSIRFGNWSAIFDRDEAADWARSWRQAVQWYIHAYQTVTGVDLSADMSDTRVAEDADARALQPSFHLRRRMVEVQRRQGAIAPAGRRRQVLPPMRQLRP